MNEVNYIFEKKHNSKRFIYERSEYIISLRIIIYYIFIYNIILSVAFSANLATAFASFRKPLQLFENQQLNPNFLQYECHPPFMPSPCTSVASAIIACKSMS